MSVQLSVTVEGVPHGSVKPRLPVSGQSLCDCGDELSAAARGARVKRLWSFSFGLEAELKWAHKALGSPDQDEMTEQQSRRYEKEVEQQRSVVGKWFDPKEGLRCVDGIVEYLENHPELGYERCASELKVLRTILQNAKKQRRRFRLIVF